MVGEDVPPAYWTRFLLLRAHGMTAQAAVAAIVEAAGLPTDERQKKPWTLAELARLEFVKYRAEVIER